MAALLFLPAWTVNYWQAWVFLAVFFLSISAIIVYLMKKDPRLLERRMHTTEEERSQKIIRFLINLAFFAVIVVSVLDHRLGWSKVPSSIVIAGDALVALGLLLIFFVFRENTFAASTVKVEAGQKVISTGPYALLRHPMYLGGLMMFLGIPPALGSWWGLFLIALFIPAGVWRILDEEEVLAKDLPGYAAYRNKVKRRLVPFVW